MIDLIALFVTRGSFTNKEEQYRICAKEVTEEIK